MSDKRNREAWKVGIDTLSMVSFVFLVIVCPLWMHYHPHTHDAQGHFVWMVKASFAVTPPCALGLIWIFVRYSRFVPAEYSLSKPLIFVRWVLAFLAMNCLVYLILTNMVWN